MTPPEIVRPNHTEYKGSPLEQMISHSLKIIVELQKKYPLTATSSDELKTLHEGFDYLSKNIRFIHKDVLPKFSKKNIPLVAYATMLPGLFDMAREAKNKADEAIKKRNSGIPSAPVNPYHPMMFEFSSAMIELVKQTPESLDDLLSFFNPKVFPDLFSGATGTLINKFVSTFLGINEAAVNIKQISHSFKYQINVSKKPHIKLIPEVFDHNNPDLNAFDIASDTVYCRIADQKLYYVTATPDSTEIFDFIDLKNIKCPLKGLKAEKDLDPFLPAILSTLAERNQIRLKMNGFEFVDSLTKISEKVSELNKMDDLMDKLNSEEMDFSELYQMYLSVFKQKLTLPLEIYLNHSKILLQLVDAEKLMFTTLTKDLMEKVQAELNLSPDNLTRLQELRNQLEECEQFKAQALNAKNFINSQLVDYNNQPARSFIKNHNKLNKQVNESVFDTSFMDFKLPNTVFMADNPESCQNAVEIPVLSELMSHGKKELAILNSMDEQILQREINLKSSIQATLMQYREQCLHQAEDIKNRLNALKQTFNEITSNESLQSNDKPVLLSALHAVKNSDQSLRDVKSFAKKLMIEIEDIMQLSAHEEELKYIIPEIFNDVQTSGHAFIEDIKSARKQIPQRQNKYKEKIKYIESLESANPEQLKQLVETKENSLNELKNTYNGLSAQTVENKNTLANLIELRDEQQSIHDNLSHELNTLVQQTAKLLAIEVNTLSDLNSHLEKMSTDFSKKSGNRAELDNLIDIKRLLMNAESSIPFEDMQKAGGYDSFEALITAVNIEKNIPYFREFASKQNAFFKPSKSYFKKVYDNLNDHISKKIDAHTQYFELEDNIIRLQAALKVVKKLDEDRSLADKNLHTYQSAILEKTQILETLEREQVAFLNKIESGKSEIAVLKHIIEITEVNNALSLEVEAFKNRPVDADISQQAHMLQDKVLQMKSSIQALRDLESFDSFNSNINKLNEIAQLVEKNLTDALLDKFSIQPLMALLDAHEANIGQLRTNLQNFLNIGEQEDAIASLNEFNQAFETHSRTYASLLINFENLKTAAQNLNLNIPDLINCERTLQELKVQMDENQTSISDGMIRAYDNLALNIKELKTVSELNNPEVLISNTRAAMDLEAKLNALPSTNVNHPWHHLVEETKQATQQHLQEVQDLHRNIRFIRIPRQNRVQRLKQDLNNYTTNLMAMDTSSAKDIRSRLNFIEGLQGRLNEYNRLGNDKDLLQYLYGHPNFKGRYFNPLLNRIAVTLIEAGREAIPSQNYAAIPSQNYAVQVPLILKNYDLKYNQAINGLYAQINSLKSLAAGLKNNDPCKAIMINLADKLTDDIDRFVCKHPTQLPSPEAYNTFKAEFTARLHSQDDRLYKHRSIMLPVVVNILAALLVPGRLLYTKIKYNEASFFLCGKDEKQRQMDSLERSLNQIPVVA